MSLKQGATPVKYSHSGVFCQHYISYKQPSRTWLYGEMRWREWWTERKRCNGAIGSSCERAAGVIVFLGLPSDVPVSLPCLVFLILPFSYTLTLRHSQIHTRTHTPFLSLSIPSFFIALQSNFCLVHVWSATLCWKQRSVLLSVRLTHTFTHMMHTNTHIHTHRGQQLRLGASSNQPQLHKKPRWLPASE